MPSKPAPTTVKMICPNLRCRSILAVPGAARGKMVRCKACGMRINVPAGQGQGASSGQG